MSDYQGQQPQDPQQPQAYPQQPAQPAYSAQPAYQQPAQAPPAAAPGAPAEPKGFAGMFQDPSTLASTGLILAVVCSVGAGFINFLSDPGFIGFRGRLISLTDTVDVGDVALIGIAVALLVVTPDPPGGIPRRMLLQAATVLGAIVCAFGLIRSVVLLNAEGEFVSRGANFITTLGVAVAAATVAFYAIREAAIAKKAEAAEAAAA